MKRVFSCLAIVALGLSTLTACDPPMPPDVQAQIAEQTYTCVAGDASVAFPALMSDLSEGFAASLSSACTDPVMSLSNSDAATSAIVISPYKEACSAYESVPFALEAADIYVYFADGYSISLSPKTIAGIFDGSITGWSDKAIAKDNPDLVLPNEPIVLTKSADALAVSAMQDWLKGFGVNFAPDFQDSQSDEIPAFVEGQIGIVKHSVVTYNSLSPVGIIVGSNKDGLIIATADNAGIGSAATQQQVTKSSGRVDVSVNHSQAPLVMSGFDSASTPYGAIYPVMLNLCGENSLVARAVARFLLRLDSQGSLGASNYNPLSEAVRAEALVEVSKGLKLPKVSK